MNEFFKLLRDIIIYIPLGALAFGVFFSLIAVSKENVVMLKVGLILFLYGLIASYIRQIYKDTLMFLKKEMTSYNSEYIRRWKKYNFEYYVFQFLLLGIFIYIIYSFGSTINTNYEAVTPLSIASLFELTPLGWNAISAIVLAITSVFIAIQARGTRELVDNQTRPVIEVSIINTQEEGTIIHFLNKKEEIPALTWMTIEIFVDGKKVNEKLGPKFTGQEPWRVVHLAYKTAGIVNLTNLKNKYVGQKIELSLEIYLAPLFLQNRKFRFYKKYYRFDFKTQQWLDTHWGISDKFVMHQSFLINNEKK